MPDGIQITIRRAGWMSFPLIPGIFLMNSLIMCSEAWKSAITPSFNGRMVLMSSWVFPCMCFACSPTAIGLPVERSIATMEGWSITILLLCIISVLAVPKTIAISCVNISNKPIIFFRFLLDKSRAQRYEFRTISGVGLANIWLKFYQKYLALPVKIWLISTLFLIIDICAINL